jgi:hypothetical protein
MAGVIHDPIGGRARSAALATPRARRVTADGRRVETGALRGSLHHVGDAASRAQH